MKRLLIVAFATLFLSLSVLAQSFTTTVYKKEDGIAIVNSTSERQIGFVIKGKGISFIESPSGSIIVDNEGVRLFVSFIKKSEFFDLSADKTDEGILDYHRDLEIAEMEKFMNGKMTLDINPKGKTDVNIMDIRESEKLQLVRGLYWSFMMPGFDDRRSSFQAALIGDVILSVGTTYPSTKTPQYPSSQNPEKVREYLRDLLVTLVIMDPKEAKKPAPKKVVTKKRVKSKAKKN